MNRSAALVAVVLLGAISVFLWHIVGQYSDMYCRGIALAESAFKHDGADAGEMTHRILMLATAQAMVTFKAAGLFLGAIITILGSLFVLTTATADYAADLKGPAASGTLRTSSPGLVMISLGVVVIAISLLSKSELTDPTADRVATQSHVAEYERIAHAFDVPGDASVD